MPQTKTKKKKTTRKTTSQKDEATQTDQSNPQTTQTESPAEEYEAKLRELIKQDKLDPREVLQILEKLKSRGARPLNAVERAFIWRVLEEVWDNKTTAARVLSALTAISNRTKLSESTAVKFLSKLGLEEGPLKYILTFSREELENAVSKESVMKIISALSIPDSFIPLSQVRNIIRYRTYTTGVPPLDRLLGKGVGEGGVYEFAGPFSSGKTQTLLTIMSSVLSQTPKHRVAVYLDTEGIADREEFIERIRPILRRFGLGEEDEDRIILYFSDDVDTFLEQLRDLRELINKGIVDPAIIVVDSISDPFRSSFSGRGELSERQQTLKRVVTTLKKIARRVPCVVLVASQVMASPDGFGPSIVVSGGHVLAHSTTQRILLVVKKKDPSKGVTIFSARVEDSPYGGPMEVTLMVTEEGVFPYDKE